jgi:murein DD-endopeptidase MepM/ murein hydrolase activator NlpD
MRPVAQRVTAAYKIKGKHWASGYHTGIDYGSPTGTTCKAATAGTVKHAGASSGAGGMGSAYGTQVVIESKIGGTTYRCLYAHLSSVAVKRGATVKIGQVIGKTGRTGNVTGPHLHFEVRRSPFTYRSDVNPAVAVNVKAASQSRVSKARTHLRSALDLLNAAITQGGRKGPVIKGRNLTRRALNHLPKN